MPPLGFGTYEIKGEACTKAVAHALSIGLRLVDTAAVYRNEAEVGSAIRASGVDRSELFLVTKLRPHKACQGENAYAAALESLKALQVDYVDLFLVHWPGVAGREKDGSDEEKRARNASMRKSTWQSLERLIYEGKTKHLGVSNYTVAHLSELLFGGWAKARPVVNQFELHPRLQQRELVSFCQANKVQVMAYSSLAKGDVRLLGSPTLRYIAETLNCTVPQCVLKWALQKGFVIIPKSEHEERRIENFDLSKVLLAPSMIESIDLIEETEGGPFRSAWDPTDIL